MDDAMPVRIHDAGTASGRRRNGRRCVGRGLLIAGLAALAGAAQAGPSLRGPGTLSLEGTSAAFSFVVVYGTTGSPNSRCASLDGGYGDNHALAEVLAANRRGRGASTPLQATVELHTPGGRPVTYLLSGVTIARYSESANSRGRRPSVTALSLNCTALQVAS